METKENLNKGITLVALVITIIILLILAGVAITALTQTGLFENAKQAQNAMENAQTKENATLEDYVNKIDGKISGNRENIENIGVELLTDPIIIDTSTNFEEKNLDFEISDISQYNYLLLTYGPYTESNKSFGISTQLLNKKTIENSIKNKDSIIYLNSATGNNWSAAECRFKNSNMLSINYAGASNSGRKKFAIISIEGIK